MDNHTDASDLERYGQRLASEACRRSVGDITVRPSKHLRQVEEIIAKTHATKKWLVIILAIAGVPIAAVGVLAIGWVTFMVSTRHDANRKGPMKQIYLDLSRLDEMKSHIKKWVPASAVNEDKLLGTIENERVMVILRQNGLDCSFETELITVDIDTSKEDSVEYVFIASTPMRLHNAIASMTQLLTILEIKPHKLKKWEEGALAWSKNPKAWPTGAPTPLDAGYSEASGTIDKWYSVEIRSSDNSAKPCRITLRTGPRKVNVAKPLDEPANEGLPRTTGE